MLNDKICMDELIDAVVFDCDGTLCHIEGIDELASEKGVGEIVAEMTATAMAKTGLNPELYQQRLDLVRPSKQQVCALGQAYFIARNEDVLAVIELLQYLGKTIFIISAGVNPSVQIFGKLLGVPLQHIFAVDLQFDEKGEYVSFDKSSPLVRKNGKREIIRSIQQQYPRVVFIGDGLNDLEASDLVTRFIGYGGTYYRENIANQCEYYLSQPSLSGLLPLTLTEAECKKLPNFYQDLLAKGIENYSMLPNKQAL